MLSGRISLHTGKKLQQLVQIQIPPPFAMTLSHDRGVREHAPIEQSEVIVPFSRFRYLVAAMAKSYNFVFLLPRRVRDQTVGHPSQAHRVRKIV